MHDAGCINWADLKKAIAVMKAPPPPSADLGIVRNPMPNYPNPPVVRDPSSSSQGAHQVTTLFTSEEPTCIRTQTWNFEGEEPINPPQVFTTRGRQDAQLTAILREEVNRYAETLQSPDQDQEEPTISNPAPSGPSVQSGPHAVPPLTPRPCHSGANEFQLIRPLNYADPPTSSHPHHTGASDFQLLLPPAQAISPNSPHPDQAGANLLQSHTVSPQPNLTRAQKFQLIYPEP